MPLDSVGGSSNVTGPFRTKAAAPSEAPAEAPAREKPAARGETDSMSLGLGFSSEIGLEDLAPTKAPKAFDVSDASERLIDSHKGDLEQAYFESLDMRNTSKKDPGYGAKLADYSKKLGYDRNLTADEMRDIEHFMFAAASVAEKGQVSKKGEGRELAVLKREPQAVAMGVLTVGYTAAKAVNKLLPQDLKFLKSRTDPSIDEVTAGLKGIWRGMKDKL